ncbi:T-cell antigen CD7-like [Thamnophis elegans]|uniref:T-cell antigen CD7-like n=1 Tax=Thamnophis elegans TaxID=35005 RepID=UPI00137788D9|nr:T-cell antigen CD7-like [Thamnophis elegans]
MLWILSAYFLLLLSPGNAEPKDKMVSQELMVLIAEEGQSVNLTCQFMYGIEGLYLKQTYGNIPVVLYVTHSKIKTEAPTYENRTEYFEMNNTATITLKQLKKNDSNVYMCVANLTTDSGFKQKNSTVNIFLAIKAPSKKNFQSPWMLYIFISVLMLLFFMFGSCIIYHANVPIKKCFQKDKAKKRQNFIYEDMTYSLRCKNTETQNHQYTL